VQPNFVKKIEKIEKIEKKKKKKVSGFQSEITEHFGMAMVEYCYMFLLSRI
jgi:hypothetical protein